MSSLPALCWNELAHAGGADQQAPSSVVRLNCFHITSALCHVSMVKNDSVCFFINQDATQQISVNTWKLTKFLFVRRRQIFLKYLLVVKLCPPATVWTGNCGQKQSQTTSVQQPKVGRLVISFILLTKAATQQSRQTKKVQKGNQHSLTQLLSS